MKLAAPPDRSSATGRQQHDTLPLRYEAKAPPAGRTRWGLRVVEVGQMAAVHRRHLPDEHGLICFNDFTATSDPHDEGMESFQQACPEDSVR
ncbi:MAG TPA: hypothetical protein VNO70_18685 [Blastocatellia bacterium]|nr:hypothetical protein [Blastocatellia bacterium]